MKPISIIIPSYNAGKYLPKTIESVFSQTKGGWELIIINDGSSDDTAKLVKPYLKDDRVSYYYQSNKGVSSARNLGAQKSKGDYLIFLDSDDYLLPRLMESLFKSDYNKYDLITWEVLKIIDGKRRILKPKNLGSIYNRLCVSFLAGSVCYKKDFFLKAGKFDTSLNFGENYELGLRLCQLEPQIKVLNRPYLVYNLRTSERTSNSVNNRLDSGLRQYEKHKRKYKSDPYEDSKMNYILGYLMERKGKRSLALKYYNYSWKTYPLNYKAFLKMVYMKLKEQSQ